MRSIWSIPIGPEHLGVEPIVETIGSHGHVVIHGEQVSFPDQHGLDVIQIYIYKYLDS